ncbi:MAG TPA: carboxypeptidase-like regulatory domain-containing protein, partial [Planctomycetota bacterium]|nr:carboxypeptidase-like regulatory domain-containing protein [Planctomycetota bacterium]
LTALSPGEVRPVDFVLRRGSRVAGVVRTLDELPLAEADVELRRLDLSISDMSGMMEDGGRGSETTDAEGRFAFESVPDGSYQVVLDEDGYRDSRSEKLVLVSGREVADLSLLADPGLSVAGRVVDAEGRPVPQARVSGRRPRSLTDLFANLNDHLIRDTADEEGRFRLAGFDPGAVTLEAEAAGFIDAGQDVQAGATELTVTLQPSCSLSGIVVSTADGEPVRDFSVKLKPAAGIFDPSDPFGIEKRIEGARADRRFRDREDGTFTLEDLEPGDFDLSVQAAGFGDTTVAGIELGSEGRKGVVVMLPPESVVTGRVVSARTGLAIEGATISPARGSAIEQMFEGAMGKGPRDTTDAEGRFRLDGLGARPLSLHVRHPSFRERTEEAVVLAPGETRDLGTIALSNGGAVRGRVLDTHGRGVPSVVVLLTNSTGSTIKRDSTDPEGRYEIGGLPPGTFNVMRADFTMELGEDASPMDFLKDLVMQSVTLAEDEEREVDLRVDTGGGTRLHGTVRGSDGPAEGAMVSLVPERGGYEKLGMAMTDKRGDYEIEGVEPGEYLLQVVMLDAGMTAGSQPASPVVETLAVAGPEQRHDVRLPGGALN